MQEACKEIRGCLDSDFIDTGVTVDGTWQERGFTSMNGAVAAIPIDTVCAVDRDIVSRYCQKGWHENVNVAKVINSYKF